MPKIISRGAEAILSKDGAALIKTRIPKSYRLPILDEKLRKARTKKEAKLLNDLKSIIPIPKLIKADQFELKMQFIKGKKLSDNLDSLPNALEICEQIGKNIAKLHDSGIIHGDLTTSNMIYQQASNRVGENSQLSKSKTNIKTEGLSRVGKDSGTVFFIDFGLSFHSQKIEDKAVDLHLIKQALEAKHFKHYEKFFKAILEGYKTSKEYKQIIARLKKVETRGRYKRAY